MVLTGVNKVRNARSIRQCTRIIDEVFDQFGLDPRKNRVKEKNVIGWIAKRGKAVIYLLLNENKRLNTLRIISPMVYIPEKNREAFLRRCLEINFSIINCALAVDKDFVSIVSERPLTGLNPEEVAYALDNLSRLADDLEKDLKKEFGAKLYP
jgi:hypothetical protein